MLELGFTCFLAYLVGSVSGSLVVGRLFGGGDIRAEGSRNAGATNALRTRGLSFALPVVLIDIAKGALAAGWLPGLGILAQDPEVPRIHLQVCAGAAAVVGHIWPFWHGFRGGKGAATLVGAFLVLAPGAVGIVVAVWLLGVIATGYVGLWTMIAATLAPVYLWLNAAGRSMVGFGIAMALLLIFAHRENIRRLRDGTENRMTRAMFWRRQDPS
ncbi:MAG: glycerol-3-phosphate 1-O-acyltransferase PlsY [Pseudomonadota bacterium]